MRIWDIHPKHLCRNHLLGEHRELHALWSILVHNKKGYRHHPETLRWEGKLKALYTRHEMLVREMLRRNYNHHSPLEKRYASGKGNQTYYIDHPRKQRMLLRNKPCECLLSS